MRVINVVTIKNNVVDNIDSFGVFEEQLSDEVVEAAEKAFVEKAKELGFNPDVDSEIDPTDELLDNAYYENRYFEEKGKVLYQHVSVCISWSDI